jgi:hypothetical protein
MTLQATYKTVKKRPKNRKISPKLLNIIAVAIRPDKNDTVFLKLTDYIIR